MRLLAIALTLTAGLALVRADDLGDDLLAAARKGDVAQAKALLDKGANVNALTRYQQTPLFFACDRGNLELAKLLIERGADLNAKDNFYSATPMTWAMMKKNKDIIALLIEKGSDPTEALTQSIQSNNKEMFQLILDKGKTTPAMLSDALQLADSTKRTEMSDALKAKGVVAKVYAVDAETLASYAGAYSDGGSLSLEVAVKDGKLMFNQQGFSAPATPIAKDEFKLLAQGLTLKFDHDADGKVSAMRLPGRGGDTVLKRSGEKK
jgi:Ankyrin repeats (many copies)